MYKFLLNCPEPPAKKKQKLRSIDVMIRKLDCSVYCNNRTDKLLKLEPKKNTKI